MADNAFANGSGEVILIAADFSQASKILHIKLPRHMFDFWNMPEGENSAENLMETNGNLPEQKRVCLGYDATVELPVDRYGIAIIKLKR